MSRFYLRLTFIPIVLFTALFFIIRAQPYDDHELRQLLLPEGCPAPCFMGIRPGVTTMDEAVTILKESGWVSKVTVDSDSTVSWEWNDQKPSWIKLEGGLVSYNDRVTYIEIGTSLPLGIIFKELGQNAFVENEEFVPQKYILYGVGYENYYFHFDVVADCKNRDAYLQPVSILIQTAKGENNQNLYSVLKRFSFRC